MSHATKFGRNHVAEPPSSLRTLHFHAGGKLTEVDHEPKVAVLDQEDLLAQGIHTSELVPGAADADALGSCVFNATTAALSNVLPSAAFAKLTGADYIDTVGAEEYAIRLYHATTDLTGDPSTEWPPTDCGSSGVSVAKELQQQKIVSGYKTAHGPTNIVSLMQHDGLMVGQPFFNSWMDPDSSGFVDGDGSMDALQAAIASGVAGGHETFWSAVEKVTVDVFGQVVPEKTVIRFRNSWSASWGMRGSALVHLSTYVALASYCDFRQLVA